MQALIELSPQGEVSPELGEQIIPLLAGTSPGHDETYGVGNYFTPGQLHDILESERQTQLLLMARQECSHAVM